MICVTYLLLDAFATRLCKPTKDFEMRQQSYPLYDYAAQYWGHHAHAASTEVVRLILDLLRSKAKLSASSQAMMLGKEHRYGNYIHRTRSQITGVHIAADFGLAEVTKELLKNGFHLDAKDNNGKNTVVLGRRVRARIHI